LALRDQQLPYLVSTKRLAASLAKQEARLPSITREVAILASTIATIVVIIAVVLALHSRWAAAEDWACQVTIAEEGFTWGGFEARGLAIWIEQGLAWEAY
jgi:hypothetical protein